MITPRRVRTAISQRRFQARARRELETERFIGELLQQRPELSEAGRLAPFEQRVFSQNGEDGVISEIFRRIGTTNQFFVEFGCGNGVENNTLYLLHRDWEGLWLDGDGSLVTSISRSHGVFIEPGTLRLDSELVTAENVERAFRDRGVPEEPDLVSIDIDGNDYWVWQALETFRPRVVVIEYNALWPSDMRWVQSYAPGQAWDGTTYHGASLASLTDLGEKKGYRLVHCDLAGVNAFFVRADLLGDQFADSTSVEAHYQPARYYLSSVVARPRSFGPFDSI